MTIAVEELMKLVGEGPKQVKKAVVLLSGGIDSAVTAYIARKDIGKGELYALTFNYGQRHSKEISCSNELAGELSLIGPTFHFNLKLPTIPCASSLLSSTSLYPRETGVEEGIPDTWVPQRNSIFLALAFAYAETVGANYVYTGFNIRDYSGYPDCRPEFVEAINKALNLASKRYIETGRGIGIVTPLMLKHKWEIVKLGSELGVPFELTWSCYQGREKACSVCDSCRIRRKAFEEAGIEDPIPYEVR